MQKKLIALAIAGLAAAPAFADSNVTIYGSIDFGVVNSSGDNGGVTNRDTRTEYTSGGSAGNRIGFRGAEDLGNGLKAIFEVEFGFSGDENVSVGFNSNRHAYVGLTGGFGTVVGGRLDGVRYGVYNAYDPFAGGSIGNFTQMTTQYDRASNAVAYISPKWNGFGLVLAHATDTQGSEGDVDTITAGGCASDNGNGCDDRLYTIMGTYDNGPLSVKLDYETTTTQDASGDDRLYVATAGASYDFGVAKISAVYDVIKGEDNSFIGGGAGALALNCSNVTVCDTTEDKYDRRNYFVAASVPLGKFTLMANYGKTKLKNQDDADASKWAIGAKYALSKRTNLYTAYSQISNDDNADFEISQSAASNGGGHGVKGFEFGMRHTF